jgi:small subunit ribosomal protein S2
MKDLLEAGVHFGSLTHTWNPRMKPFIHGKRNRIHIINLVHTVRGLAQGLHFLREVSATGRQIVFVGTKRHMQSLVKQEAVRVDMPWVIERWLGGTLTNFKTVRSRLGRLEEIEAMEADGSLAELKKKKQATIGRELRRIRKNLSGLRTLNRIPGALLVVDPRREHIAVAEAKRMGVPVVALLDTDCDPYDVDISIPANDDSIRSVSLLLGKLTDAIAEGASSFKASGRAPEDATGVRQTQEGASLETAHEMLASSRMAEQVGVAAAAASATADAPAADAPAADAPAADAPASAEKPATEKPAAESPAEGATEP